MKPAVSRKERDRTRTAYHEAGHAVVAWRLHLLDKKGASIIGREDSKGRAHVHTGRGDNPAFSCSDSARLRMEKWVVVAMAGIEAQRRWSPRSVRKYHSSVDYERAKRLFEQVVDIRNEEYPVYWKLLQIRTKNWVNSLWPQIEKIAARLLLRGTLTRDEIQELLFPGSLEISASLRSGGRQAAP
jgi:hypothetical protein